MLLNHFRLLDALYSPHQSPASGAASPLPSASSSSQQSSAGSGALPPGQPAMRMTDSTSGPNGPPLKYAALSVESYHLDSPPFTGTAVGGAREQDRMDAAVRTSMIDQRQDAASHRSPSQRPVRSDLQEGSSSSRQQSSQVRSGQSEASSGGAWGDVDVPSWNLDSSSKSSGVLRPPLPQGSSSRGEEGRRRPLHTQLTDDQDHSERMNQHEPDQEVDGDGTGFVLGGRQGQEIVPVQSQQKVSQRGQRKIGQRESGARC
ncbi:hypothetical protein BCV69DRAFT_169746 [Microstroma glucosiphilum]|uniref:Uncharacterized protein n=1 Tax=Pseudomicrostroma glucosiphilum TaxID=1684307 RepID=A0A316UAC4_9BASI|nr:hypothetical protein BCV69DRAFT_169746 [Pseudomicrostroma glucosiphilum]PWN21421.1 hypothetical protein BCV69DRAFT_169746 [Pseudomicrostroma glucosiphilum]